MYYSCAGSRPSQPVAGSPGPNEPSPAAQHLRGALELAGLQGPSQLERAQLEIKQLQEGIGTLSSNFPRATEAADAQVVAELTKRLARLLELERFCTPAPGSDGAKEYLERLREEHRSKWGRSKSKQAAHHLASAGLWPGVGIKGISI